MFYVIVITSGIENLIHNLAHFSPTWDMVNPLYPSAQSCLNAGIIDGRFTFEQIHKTKEQIYCIEIAENHDAKEWTFKLFK